MTFTHMTKDGNHMQQQRNPQGGETPVHSLRDFVKVYESMPSEVTCRDIIERFAADAGNHLLRAKRNVRVEESGETLLSNLRMQVGPRRGRCLMYRPFWIFEHAGLKPVSNPRSIMGTCFTFPVDRE